MGNSLRPRQLIRRRLLTIQDSRPRSNPRTRTNRHQVPQFWVDISHKLNRLIESRARRTSSNSPRNNQDIHWWYIVECVRGYERALELRAEIAVGREPGKCVGAEGDGCGGGGDEEGVDVALDTEGIEDVEGTDYIEWLETGKEKDADVCGRGG